MPRPRENSLEKAKDFKGSIKRIFGYLTKHKIS